MSDEATPPEPTSSEPTSTEPATPVPPVPQVPPTPPAPPGVPRARPEPVPRVVEVTVSSVQPDVVEVRLADGRLGAVPVRDLTAPSNPGDTLRVAVLARTDPAGRVLLSAEWARKLDAWAAAEAAMADKSALRGRVTKEVKGGWVVDLGVRAFLPRSLAGVSPGDTADLVGREVEVTVHELDRARDRLVVSRRDLLRRAQRGAEKAAWADLAVGQRRTGTVVAVEDYGAKVDLQPLRGLIHRSELSWGRVGHPSEVVQVGAEVEVEVLEVSRSKRRIGLSLRRAQTHPFDGIAAGEVRSGTVVRVVDYGAFVSIDGTEAEGLLHVSQISELPGQRADQLVVPGEALSVTVLSVDRERHRLALSVLPGAVPESP